MNGWDWWPNKNPLVKKFDPTGVLDGPEDIVDAGRRAAFFNQKYIEAIGDLADGNDVASMSDHVRMVRAVIKEQAGWEYGRG